MNFLRSLRQTTAALSFASLALALTATAGAANPLDGMKGSWSGGGHFRLENGKTESIRCTAHYSPRGGSSLGLALRCASSSSRVELRASLTTNGGRVSGTWEERSYNASGSVSGIAAGNSLRLAI